MRFIHKIAVDHIGDGYSETYCGYAGSLFDDDFQDHCSNDKVTCPDCLAEMKKDEEYKNIRPKRAYTVLGHRLYEEAKQAVAWYGHKGMKVSLVPALSYTKAKRILWMANELGIKE